MAEKATSILDVISKATAADLAAIDAELATLTARVNSLQAARKLIDVVVNGKPERAKPAPRKAKADGAPTSGGMAAPATVDRRRRIAELLGAGGPLLKMVIADRLDMDGRAVGPLLNCDWFEATSQGYRLTETGRREARLAPRNGVPA